MTEILLVKGDVARIAGSPAERVQLESEGYTVVSRDAEAPAEPEHPEAPAEPEHEFNAEELANPSF